MFFNKKEITIPKDNAQIITELESWTIEWKVKTGWSNDTKVSHKCFINELEAKEFEKQLKESAKFINAWIETNFYKN